MTAKHKVYEGIAVESKMPVKGYLTEKNGKYYIFSIEVIKESVKQIN